MYTSSTLAVALSRSAFGGGGGAFGRAAGATCRRRTGVSSVGARWPVENVTPAAYVRSLPLPPPPRDFDALRKVVRRRRTNARTHARTFRLRRSRRAVRVCRQRNPRRDSRATFGAALHNSGAAVRQRSRSSRPTYTRYLFDKNILRCFFRPFFLHFFIFVSDSLRTSVAITTDILFRILITLQESFRA